MKNAFLWFEVDKAGEERVWHVRDERTGLEIACTAVLRVSWGETIVDGKKRRLPVNHALYFDGDQSIFVNAIAVRGRKRSA